VFWGTFMVSWAEPVGLGVIELGVIVVVQPFGAIVDSATEPANSFIEVTVTVAIPEPPCMMFRLVGLAVKLKSGLVTVTVIVVDRSVPLVLVPFIIIAVDPTSVPEGTAIVNSAGA